MMLVFKVLLLSLLLLLLLLHDSRSALKFQS